MTKEEIIKDNAKTILAKCYEYDKSDYAILVDVIAELLTKIYELSDKVELLEIHQKDIKKDFRRSIMWENVNL